jgi:ATP-dependent DNA helicase RecQ
VAAVAEALDELRGSDVERLAEHTGLSRSRVTAALTCLDDGAAGEDAGEAAARAGEEREARAKVQQSRVEMMRAYAEARGCRRQVLLGYFGEPLDEPCGNCDRCRAGAGAGGQEAGEVLFPVNGRVAHPVWGPGQVMGYEGDTVTVFFDAVGYKTLAIELVLANHLLTPEG